MKKRTRRKVYALVNPITLAIDGAHIATDDVLAKLRVRELLAIESFAAGRATAQEWRDIADMQAIAETMARNGIGVEVLEVCMLVQAALIEAQRRYHTVGKMGTTGPGLVAMRELYTYHDLQRTSVARSVYETMIVTTMNRLKSRAPEVIKL